MQQAIVMDDFDVAGNGEIADCNCVRSYSVCRVMILVSAIPIYTGTVDFLMQTYFGFWCPKLPFIDSFITTKLLRKTLNPCW
jgi:hypothetical protein